MKESTKPQLVYPKERAYFLMMLIVSVGIYLLLAISISGIVIFLVGEVLILTLHGLFIGHLRGNSIRISEKQFPEVFRIATRLAEEMGLRQMPAIYVLQSGGPLNAFATWFISRNFVVIYSSVLELAYQKGEPALTYVIAHELAHIKRKHVIWSWPLAPARTIPFLAAAYSRACEYTCDRFGAYYSPSGGVEGVLVIAAGTQLYHQVNVGEFENQAKTERGFWVWFAEALSSHPHLSKRLRAIKQFLGTQK